MLSRRVKTNELVAKWRAVEWSGVVARPTIFGDSLNVDIPSWSNPSPQMLPRTYSNLAHGGTAGEVREQLDIPNKEPFTVYGVLSEIELWIYSKLLHIYLLKTRVPEKNTVTVVVEVLRCSWQLATRGLTVNTEASSQRTRGEARGL
jgi:hypothetical protein